MSRAAIEAERLLLSCAIRDAERVTALDVRPDDFQRPDHRALWLLIVGLVSDGLPSDPVSIEAATLADPDEVGGLAYVLALSDLAPSIEAASHYATTVRAEADRRRLRASLADALRALDDPDPAHGLATASALALRAMESAAPSSAVTRAEALDALRSELDQDDPDRGVPVELPELARLTPSLMPGQLWLLGALPGAGKTALMLQMEDWAVLSGRGVLFLSLEMPARELAARHVARRGYDQRRQMQTTRRSHGSEWCALDDAIGAATTELAIYDDRPQLTEAEATAAIRAADVRLTRQGARLGLVLVDYLQIMRAETADGSSLATALGRISSSLKAAAKRHRCAVVLAVQLNRNATARGSKEPVISDVRDSSAPAADADVVLMIHREVMHDDTADPKRARLLVRKARGMGQVTGAADVRWDGFGQRFHDELEINIK